MQLTFLALLFTLSLPTAFATVHTQCFNYFFKKDGCVHGTPGSKQCGASPHLGTAAAFSTRSRRHKRSDSSDSSDSHALERRYDAVAPVGHTAFGQHTCPGPGPSDNAPGVCLWIGDQPHGENGGWLNYVKNSNCNKEVWIQKKDNPALSVYAPIVAACSFDDVFEKGPIPADACFHIGLTTYTFNQLNPTPAERAAGKIARVGWDFNNIPTPDIPAGTKPKNGPV